jgi:EF-P beta-lysylation protein EpmB
MIATTSPSSQINLANVATLDASVRWQRLVSEAITDPAELIDVLGLSPDLVPVAKRAAQAFGLRVPRGFVNRMERGNPDDPLLRQVLPLGDELAHVEGYSRDPVGDLKSRAAPGVLQKYNGRALLVSTGSCAVHCRYCFRRHFPYAEETASSDRWRKALDHIRTHTSLNEVILSGGDPLNLSDTRLAELTAGLSGFEHIRRLRIHTRTAVVIPERIDSGLLRWLQSLALQKVVVIHANHSREIDASVRAACARLKEAGATLFNQSVLLAGVNDSVSALSSLSETLFAAGVMPYYLSLLDHVEGASHFDVPEARAVDLLRGVAAVLPGYLVPKLVREVAGADSKTSVSLFT